MTRSDPAGTAAGDGPTPLSKSLLQRITGIIRHPRPTFQWVVSHPRWGALLLVTTLVSAAAGVALMETAVGRQALVDQWERTAAAFGQNVDDAEYARLEALSEQAGPGYAVVSALLSGPLLTLAVAGLVTLAFRRRASFRQAMGVATHAGIILTLRQLVAAPLSYLRETTASATSVGLWFPGLDETSPVARFLGALDLFVIWWAVVLAVGLAVLSGRRARTVATVLVGIYAALALLLAMAMAISGGSA